MEKERWTYLTISIFLNAASQNTQNKVHMPIIDWD